MLVGVSREAHCSAQHPSALLLSFLPLLAEDGGLLGDAVSDPLLWQPKATLGWIVAPSCSGGLRAAVCCEIAVVAVSPRC